MRKNDFKTFALILGCTTVFAACNHDDPDTDDDLISAQIIARICEANVKLFAENEITVTQTETDYAIWGTTLLFEHKREVNLSTKKSLDVQKVAGAFEEFRYYDETTHYLYQSGTDMEPENFISSKISTGYWKYHTRDLPYLSDEMVKTIGKWKEENGRLVGNNPYAGDIDAYVESKYHVTLSENNKYLKLELKSATGESLAVYEYSYTANPAFPAGY